MHSELRGSSAASLSPNVGLCSTQKVGLSYPLKKGHKNVIWPKKLKSLRDVTHLPRWWEDEEHLQAPQVVLGKLCDCLAHWRGSWDSCGLEYSQGTWLIHKTKALLGAGWAAGNHHPWECMELTSPDQSPPFPYEETKNQMDKNTENSGVYVIHD